MLELKPYPQTDCTNNKQLIERRIEKTIERVQEMKTCLVFSNVQRLGLLCFCIIYSIKVM